MSGYQLVPYKYPLTVSHDSCRNKWKMESQFSPSLDTGIYQMQGIMGVVLLYQ